MQVTVLFVTTCEFSIRDHMKMIVLFVTTWNWQFYLWPEASDCSIRDQIQVTVLFMTTFQWLFCSCDLRQMTVLFVTRGKWLFCSWPEESDCSIRDLRQIDCSIRDQTVLFMLISFSYGVWNYESCLVDVHTDQTFASCLITDNYWWHYWQQLMTLLTAVDAITNSS